MSAVLDRAQSAYDRLLFEAPYFPRCSDNKTAALVRPLEYAVKLPYMQVNRQGFVSWLVFDLDHANAQIWEDRGLPAPNFVVRNKVSGKSHLFYAINPVCTTENARNKPIQFMKAVYQTMAVKLEADPSYSGPVAKTPHHPWWHTDELHHQVYSLGELNEYVEAPYFQPGEKVDLEEFAHSRHCLLFHTVRYYAYAIVDDFRNQSDYTAFYQAVFQYAESANTFRKKGFHLDLSFSQIKATVRSIARWTWDKYTGSSKHKRIMNLDPALPVSERQRRGSAYTHQVRKEKTIERIKMAIKQLHEEGVSVTQKAIAELTGLCRQTIAKYKDLWLEAFEGSNTVNDTDVKFAPHQITAPVEHIHEENSGESLEGCLFRHLERRYKSGEVTESYLAKFIAKGSSDFRRKVFRLLKYG